MDRHRRKVAEFQTLRDDADHRGEAMEVFQCLIDGIVLAPRENIPHIPLR